VSGSAHISDLAVTTGGGRTWAMVRTHFDIKSFGVNAYVTAEPGMELVGDHDEADTKHEELFFVSSGRATFTVNGDEIDAPAGTFVFVRDPAAKRKAVGEEPGTTVVVAGGKAGEAFTPSAWERGSRYFVTQEYDKAAEVYEELLAESPGDAGLLYNLACAKSLLGRKDEALANLRQSIEANPEFKRYAVEDPDFDAIRDDPEFSAITGQTNSGGTSS
jgi:tetratricopeptide (TPR) repeat protein